MLIEQVKCLLPVERFLYWIRERHAIYQRRQEGLPKPWTNDYVLQNYYFTNPYRENDKTTAWFRDHVRGPLAKKMEVLLATLIFRWFNYIPTGEVLLKGDLAHSLYLQWDRSECLRLLKPLPKLFTGAYMIASGAGRTKLEWVTDRIDNLWSAKDSHYQALKRCTSLHQAHQVLTGIHGLGGFMAYEIVCDLRYTHLLEKANDRLTWCNPGPGAIRGMYRLLGKDLPRGNSAIMPIPAEWTAKTLEMLGVTHKRLTKLPRFEMREVEHSLCEWDKYERLLFGTGRAKRLYNGSTDLREQAKPLRKPQAAILACLEASDRWMSRNEIAYQSGVDPTKIGDYAGPRPFTQSEKTKTRWGFPTLIALDLVEVEQHDLNGVDTTFYRLSDEGKTYLSRQTRASIPRSKHA